MCTFDLDTGHMAKSFFRHQSDPEKGGYVPLHRGHTDNAVDDEDSASAYPVSGPRLNDIIARQTFASILLRILISLFTLYGILSAIKTTYLAAKSPASNPTCNCGDTISAALRNSCTYDEMAAAYLPPACIDAELSAKFSQSGPNPDGTWTYFADKNGTIPLTAYDVSQLPLTGAHFFATHEWHLLHCSYYWRKLLRGKAVVEKRYDGEVHLGHCEMMFLKRDALDKIVTEAGVSLHSDVLVIAGKHAHGEHHDDHQMES